MVLEPSTRMPNVAKPLRIRCTVFPSVTYPPGSCSNLKPPLKLAMRDGKALPLIFEEFFQPFPPGISVPLKSAVCTSDGL